MLLKVLVFEKSKSMELAPGEGLVPCHLLTDMQVGEQVGAEEFTVTIQPLSGELTYSLESIFNLFGRVEPLGSKHLPLGSTSQHYCTGTKISNT